MRRLKIIDSSVSISSVGFGCARLFGASEFRRSTAVIESALRADITHFDTAPMYGSEGILGEVFQGVKDITITTKIGIARPEKSLSFVNSFARPIYRQTMRPLLGRVPSLKSYFLRAFAARKTQADNKQPSRRISKDEFMREFELSLKLLRRDQVDIYLLHEPDQFEITDELHDLFADLKSCGAIGAFGLAYGDHVPRPAPRFGSVVQGRLRGDVAPAPNDNVSTILHGVLRQGGRLTGPKLNAGQKVSQVLDISEHFAVLFSASSPYQVLQLHNQLRRG